MSNSALCSAELNSHNYGDENGVTFETDMEPESKKFKGRILSEADFLLVIQNSQDSELERSSFNAKTIHEELNSNNNNNANNAIVDYLQTDQESASSKTPKYVALLRQFDEAYSNDDLDVSDSEGCFFLLHTLESGCEEETKTFFEKLLLHSTSTEKTDEIDKNHCSSEPLLMCFPCKLTFTFGPSFAGHVINHHGLDLTDLEIQVLELDNVNAVLQKIEDKCQVCYLDPIRDPDLISKELGSLDTINEKLKVNEVIKRKAGTAGGRLLDILSKRKAKARKQSLSTNQAETEEKQGSSASFRRNTKSTPSVVDTSIPVRQKSTHKSRKSASSRKTESRIVRNDQKQGLDLSLANDSRKSSSTSLTSSTTVAKQRMLDCQTMSFAVASPLDPHAQSPTAHPILLNNVMHNEGANFTHEPKTKEMEFAAFLSDRKGESEQALDENPGLVSTSQSFVSPSSPPPSSRDMRSSSTPDSSSDPNVSSSSLLPGSLGTRSQNDVESLLSSTSSVDSMFPISLFQSRNSCKTLKCPKCNWHYKYRQTLEAHMKEKHFDETSDCVYCNAGQPHPRLSRGESYSCGYKPFKCNVCNYSTTTKGNLSIHMQSDKHLYNARSLQQRQQDRIRQGGSSFSGSSTHSGDTNTSQNENANQSGVKRSDSPGSAKISEYNGVPMEKHIQSRRRRSSNKTSSSVDSGVYSSTSKTDSPTSATGRRESGSSSGGKWRCDVCCYETTIARNLRIHMTSEKHAQNLALNEKGLLKHMRQDNDANRAARNERNSTSEFPQLPAPNMMDFYTAAFKSLQQTDPSGKTMGDVDDVRKAQAHYLQHQLFLAQQQQLLLAQQYQQIMMAAAASSLQQKLSQSGDDGATSALAQSKQQELILQNQMWKHLFPQTNLDTSAMLPELKSEQNKESSTLFSCGLCGVFGTDDVSVLESHVRKQRPTEGLMDPINSEWVEKKRSRDRETYMCKLCAYSTTLKTNFNLHCKTEKHSCKLNLISHVREGGGATAWMIPHIIRGSLSQSVSCNACQFVTHSLEKLKIHCASDQHQGVSSVCQYLQSLMESSSKEAKTDKERLFKFRCLPCSNFTTKHVVEMVKHMQTAEHQTQLQNQKTPLSGTLQDVVTVEKFDSSPSENQETEGKNKSGFQCEYCNYSCDDQTRMQLHQMTQHSDQPPTSCPLCQELLKSPLQLRMHLLQAHQLQTSPVESHQTSNGNTTEPIEEDIKQTNDTVTRSSDFDDVKSTELSNLENTTDCDASAQGSLILDENELGSQIETTKRQALDDSEIPQKDSQEKLNEPGESSAKNKVQDNNILNMQVLKGENASSSSKIEASEVKFASSQKAKDVFQDQSTSSASTSVLLESTSTVFSSRSCPDLMESTDSTVSISQATHYLKNEMRSRSKSYPMDKTRREFHRRVLGKYGLDHRHSAEKQSISRNIRSGAFLGEKQEENSPSNMTGKKNINVECDRSVTKIADSSENSNLENKTKDHKELFHGLSHSATEIRDAVKPVESSEKLHKLEEPPKDGFSENPQTDLASSEMDAMLVDSISSMQQQQSQNQNLLQTLLKMQSIKQTGVDLGRNNPLDNLHAGAVLGDSAGPMSANLLSQMGMYSALLQSQSLGLHPYQQLLSNVAALQQMQQIPLGLSEDDSGRGGSGSTFSGNLPQSAAALSSLENQYRAHGLEALQKQDLSAALESSALLGHIQGHSSSSLEIPAKRPRTRITDDQLKILRANFDINNSPSEDQIDEMEQRTGLPPKVIKHWFRNTLFKERQRSKDSPYNFNIPPVLSLEDAQKSSSDKQESLPAASGLSQEELEEQGDKRESLSSGKNYSNDRDAEDSRKIDANLVQSVNDPTNPIRSLLQNSESKEQKPRDLSTKDLPQGFTAGLFANPLSLLSNLSPSDKVPKSDSKPTENSRDVQQSMLSLAGLNFPKQLLPSQVAWPSQGNTENEGGVYENQSLTTEQALYPTIPSSLIRRTPRTRFTDFQLQVLQEFFDRNAYPKDDDLDKLSQTLNLSTRVIVVWFQNARQKARKSYEQQQQQYQHRTHTPPGLDSVRAGLNERILGQATTKATENLSRKLQNDIKKLTVDQAEANISRRLSIAAENQTKNTTELAIPCQMCDKTLPTLEEYQAHQRDHLAANFASILGPQYMKRFAETQNNGEKVEPKQSVLVEKEENKAKLVLGSQASSLFSPTAESAKITAANDDYSAFSKLLAAEKQSSMSQAQLQLSSPSPVGGVKRKASTSPTPPQLPLMTSKSLPTPPLHNTMGSFSEDKDAGGMQKDPKRLRTTITPDQLEYLYQQYLFDSSPSRKVIEQISEVVGLKKRVVQVWFQNTRARERKGQFRTSIARCVTSQMAQNKLCHLCRMVFRSKEELDHHIQTKHVAQLTENTSKLSPDGPAEKKMKLSTQAENIEPNDVPSPYQAVKSLISTEQLNPTATNYNSLISTASQSANTLQSIKTEPSVTNPLPLSAIKNEQFSSAANSQGIDYSQLLGRNKTHLSSIDLQNKFAALCSSSIMDVQSSKSTLSKLQEICDPPKHSSQLSIKETVTSFGNDRKISDSSTSEEDREVLKSRDTIQPTTNHSGYPSIVGSNLLIDVGCTPTKRHRTQMTSAQVRALKHCYKAFKTPTLAECELIGTEIGLAKRVVRVWFQNARAKEKKQKLRKSNASQAMDAGDFLEKDDVITLCDVCLPVVQFPSLQTARSHFFSRDHLQKLMRAVEGERTQDSGLGFTTSQSSPCSSYDSSENPLQSENFGSDSEAASPVASHPNENSSSVSTKDHNSSAIPLLVHQKGEKEQTNVDYSHLFSSNPNAFQQHQKTVQQLLGQTGSSDQENVSQALFQQALQKSLYQILKLPQTSAESQ